MGDATGLIIVAFAFGAFVGIGIGCAIAEANKRP